MPPFGVVRYTENTDKSTILFIPGKLEATSYDSSGKVVATHTVSTTKGGARLKLSLDNAGIGDYRVSGPVGAVAADGQDVALVRVSVLDASGAFVPNANHNISFAVSGPGSIYGVANGDPNDHDSDKASYRRAFKGLARVIVQAGKQGGTIKLTATADGLVAGSLYIVSK